jgi:periplasmic protein TonB
VTRLFQRREQLRECGVYLDVFEQSVLTEQRTNRPLSFLASLSAELVVVSVLVLVPLAYNDHLPGFHWKSIGVGAPLRPIEPKPIPANALRRASSGVAFPRPFVQSSLPRAHTSGAVTPGPEPWDSPRVEGGIDGLGPASSTIIAIFGNTTLAAPPPGQHPTPKTETPAPMRVSAGVQLAKLVKKVIPAYPPLARSTRTSGVVHLIGIIARDGTIRNLQLISGHPLLTRAAIEAVQQWVYQPTLLNGEPVEVIAPIDVNFTLGGQ